MFKFLAAAALATLAIPAQAAIVYNTSGVTGNQAWTGTLGLDFQVNSAVTVSTLGVFDSGSDGITNDLFVAIFNSGGTVVASATIAGGSNGGGNYKFVSIADVVLTPGTYQLASWGYDSTDLNFNAGFSGLPGPILFDSVGGSLTALGSRYSDPGTGGVFATNLDVGATRYGAGSFVAVANAVPEPTTWAMLLGGFGMVGFAMRRRGTAIRAA